MKTYRTAPFWQSGTSGISPYFTVAFTLFYKRKESYSMSEKHVTGGKLWDEILKAIVDAMPE